MSEQGDAFVRQVLKVNDTSPLSFADAVNYARHAGKSGRGAARILGIPESTLRRWARGSMPRQDRQDKVVQAVRDYRTRPSKMGDQGVILHVVSQEKKRARRERDISGGQLNLADGTLAAAHDMWVKTGDADKALAVFLNGVREPWYRAELTPREWRDGDGPDELYEYDGEGLESDYGMSIA